MKDAITINASLNAILMAYITGTCTPKIHEIIGYFLHAICHYKLPYNMTQCNNYSFFNADKYKNYNVL